MGILNKSFTTKVPQQSTALISILDRDHHDHHEDDHHVHHDQVA